MEYDLEYYENMLRQYSRTAEEISKIRWNWISEVDPAVVLDYGSGVGWFRAWRPKGIKVYSCDIASYPQTGTQFLMYDVVCFWDVLEHIPDFTVIEPILALARNVAVSIPLIPQEESFSTWKHFKPGEHLHYFTPSTLDALLAKYGFELRKAGQPECPPRKDITSVLYAKIDFASRT